MVIRVCLCSCRCLFLLAVLLPSVSSLKAREKVDVIFLKNGDKLTGEIKSLDRGIMQVSTTFMSTISIEWRGVEKIISSQFFEVETIDGSKYQGSFADVTSEGELEISVMPGASTAVPLLSVAYVRTWEETFWNRLNVNIDLGFDFTRANRNTTWNLNTEARYTVERYETVVNYSSLLTSQKEIETRTRNVLGFQYSYLPEQQNLFYAGVGRFDQNEDLGLKLRSTVGGGIGRRLIRGYRMRLGLLGGAVFTREQFIAKQEQSNVEGLAALRFDYFRFSGKEADISTTLVFYPSMSDRGRFRIDLTSRVHYEIVNDFYFSVNLFDNFDSRPPTVDTERNDFGISTTVGYKF